MKIILGAFALVSFVTAAVAADLPYLDKDFACTPAADADRYVREFNIDLNSFGGKELCNGAVDTKKLFNDLTLVEKSEFAPDAGHNLVRNFVPANDYYEWLKRETRGIERGNDMPAATAYNSGGYFTMQDGWAKLTTLGRVGTVIHEARHTEGYYHIRCAMGPYAGSSMSGCDNNYAYGGSHGVEMEYYARVVLQSKNLHPVYKSMARLMALGRANFVFNQPVIRKREAVVLVDAATARPVILADNNLVERAHAVEGGDQIFRLKRTSSGANLFFGEKAAALDLYDNGAGAAFIQDDYSYFKLLLMPRPNQPASIADAEEFDVGNMRYFVAMDPSGRLSSYNFPQGEWFRAGNPVAGAARLSPFEPSGAQGLFVVTTAGDVMPFDASTRRLGGALPAKWPTQLAAVAKYGNIVLHLQADGTVHFVGNRDVEPYPPLEGRVFSQMVNAPLYDSFDVAP